MTKDKAIKDFTASTIPKLKSFTVTSVDFISRSGEVPFEVHYSIGLGGGPIVKKVVSPAPAAPQQGGNEKARQLYVTGFPAGTDSPGLLRLFQNAGCKADKANIPSGKRFGFVTFSTELEKKRVLAIGSISGCSVSECR